MNYALKEVPCCDLCQGEVFETLATKVQFDMPYGVVICKKCGLVQLNPRPVRSEMDEFYKNEYVKYYGKAQNSEDVNVSKRGYQIFDFVKKHVISINEILEIGSGGGGNLKAFKEKFPTIKLHAIEPGNENLSSLEKLGIHRLGVFYDNQLYDLKNIDVIIASHVLEHFYSPAHVLGKLYRETNETVTLVILVPSLKSLQRKFPLEKYWFRMVHLYYFSHNTLQQVLRKCGWQIVDSYDKNGELGIVAKKVAEVIDSGSELINYYDLTREEYLSYQKRFSWLRYYFVNIWQFLKGGVKKILSGKNTCF